MVFSDLNPGRETEEQSDIFREQPRLTFHRIGPFKDIPRQHVFQKQQQGNASIDYPSFQSGLPLQELNSVERCMLGLKWTSPDFD